MSIDNTSRDVADALAQLPKDSPVWQLRAARADVKTYLQGSDAALFEPIDGASFGVVDRHAIGLRVGVITGDAAIAARHRAALGELGAAAELAAAVESGAFDALPTKLAAALRFSDKITREPREATPDDIETLLAAGFAARDVVTLGQLIAYLSFQVRLLAGLAALGGMK